MSSMSLADRIRDHVARTTITPAVRRGECSVQVRVGDVERQMKLRQRTPAICSALRGKKFLAAQHLTIEQIDGPPSGQSPRVVIRYRVTPAATAAADGKKQRDWFDAINGIMTGMFDEDGGVDEWLRKEREAFRGIDG